MAMEDLFKKLNRLKVERNAIILAHYYQEDDIQDVADFMGDSLALAQKAQQTDADIILFCGVHFMAETAKILNPKKTVLIPDLDAGCSLADSADSENFINWRNKYSDHKMISYINCSAKTKSISDIICTSSNAEKIVNSFSNKEKIIFAPDKYLGAYLNKKLNKNMKLWNGSCQVHEIFSEKEIVKLKERHQSAKILAHPECPETILNLADYIGSTSGIIAFAKTDRTDTFIIATEPGVIHQMEKLAPHKTFIPAPSTDGCTCNVCPHMKLNTLEKMVDALEEMSPEIQMEENLRKTALVPLQKMMELS